MTVALATDVPFTSRLFEYVDPPLLTSQYELPADTGLTREIVGTDMVGAVACNALTVGADRPAVVRMALAVVVAINPVRRSRRRMGPRSFILTVRKRAVDLQAREKPQSNRIFRLVEPTAKNRTAVTIGTPPESAGKVPALSKLRSRISDELTSRRPSPDRHQARDIGVDVISFCMITTGSVAQTPSQRSIFEQ